MADTNRIIKYDELMNYALNKLQTMCHNIGSFSSKVPDQYKNGSKIQKASREFAYTADRQNSGSWVNHGDVQWQQAHISRIYATTSDSFLKIVSQTNVDNDLRSFMEERGVYQSKTDMIVSTKALIHFFNNLAAFMSTRLRYIYSPIDGTTGIIFYVSPQAGDTLVGEIDNTEKLEQGTNEYTFPLPKSTITEDNYKDDNQYEIEDKHLELLLPENYATAYSFDNTTLQASMDSFMACLSNTNINIHQPLITLSWTCSSCSSSSSSSSSSCSSSSSSFIAYMDI